MDVIELLEDAGLLVPEAAAGPNDPTARELWDLLAHDTWEGTFTLLEELGAAPPLPPDRWAALAAAAEELHHARSAAWCHWRCGEAREDLVIRAELTLPPAAEGPRRTSFDGAGVLRPLWDIGLRAPDGGPDTAVAALWVEHVPRLGPGERATVRLRPLTPARWRGLRPGRRITMHEGRPVVATAVVLEARRVHGPA
ncbi:hypothetical protein HUT16_36205 [Kitasatospora sp. NA04385]|uniref:hypothetical protein n=1 Tax=Kitasatospora sp. NA04385 TaxID=2742135 RepID=UPI00159113C9|nr:hypothetical protein [Kitasatospora sp. NA04385]QKW23824.1 hypothetical protein HUT16_36205 [Kitasatospora sp. NA04385]